MRTGSSRPSACPRSASSIHGVVASPRTGRLYIAYGNQRPPGGWLLAYDLRRGRTALASPIPVRDRQHGDQPERTHDLHARRRENDRRQVADHRRRERAGHRSVNRTGPWALTTRSWGPGGRYCTSAASTTRTSRWRAPRPNRVVRKIGPLNGPGRPAVHDQRLADAGLHNREKLPRVPGQQHPRQGALHRLRSRLLVRSRKFQRTPDHGISLSPDERRLYLIDTPNGYVHVFDIRGLPAIGPALHRRTSSSRMRRPNDGWLQHSRDGRYLYVGRSGDVIDTRTRKIVAYLPPLQRHADFLEIDWRHGKPVATHRYGIGYVGSPLGLRARETCDPRQGSSPGERISQGRGAGPAAAAASGNRGCLEAASAGTARYPFRGPFPFFEVDPTQSCRRRIVLAPVHRRPGLANEARPSAERLCCRAGTELERARQEDWRS